MTIARMAKLDVMYHYCRRIYVAAENQIAMDDVVPVKSVRRCCR